MHQTENNCSMFNDNVTLRIFSYKIPITFFLHLYIFSFSVNTNRNNCASEPREDQRLYWMAVSRLPPFEAEHEVLKEHLIPLSCH